MSYKVWYDAHAMKHKRVVEKLLLANKTKEQIIEYFVFENMLQNEVDFCPLYAQNKKCHETEYLNCYFCACPNFRFSDAGIEKQEEKTKYSFCCAHSKDGNAGVYGDAIHQDCSKCTVPHAKSYVEKHFDLDWKKSMSACQYSSL